MRISISQIKSQLEASPLERMKSDKYVKERSHSVKENDKLQSLKASTWTENMWSLGDHYQSYGATVEIHGKHIENIFIKFREENFQTQGREMPIWDGKQNGQDQRRTSFIIYYNYNYKYRKKVHWKLQERRTKS